jgi:hypothetical protein
MKWKMIALTGGLMATLTFGAAWSAHAAKEKVYTLGGYTFGGFAGVNTDELAAKLKDQAGARVTRADIAIDESMFEAQLRERHIKGRLLTSLAEKHGTIWLIFDLQRPALGSALYAGEPLNAQTFEGATRIPASELAAATGLKPGDTLTFSTIKAAHDAIVALYARSAPGKPPLVRSRAKIAGDGRVSLVWLISEQ